MAFNGIAWQGLQSGDKGALAGFVRRRHGGWQMGQLPPPTGVRLDPEICVNQMRDMQGETGGGSAPTVGRIRIPLYCI